VQVPRKSALAFFGVLLLLLLPGLLAQAAHPVLGLAWTEIFAFLLPAMVATTGSNLRVAAYLRLAPARPALVALGALAGGAGYLLAGAVMVATQRLLPRDWVHAFDLGRLFEGPTWERVALSALAALLAPVCEETAFRGYVQTTLALRVGPVRAIAIAALLFAVMHLDPVRFPALVVLGAMFGWLAWRAGSIWPAIAAHAVNNGVAAGLVLAGGTPPREPPPWPDVVAPLALGAAALAPLLATFRAATPSPPPAASAVAPRDPAMPALGFSAARVPPRLVAAALVGLLSLGGIVLAALVRALSAPRPAP
jgi:hypothetical protein